MDVSNLLANERPRQRTGLDLYPPRDNVKPSGHIPVTTGHPQIARNGSSFSSSGYVGLIPASTGVMNAQRAVDAYQQHQTRGTIPKKVAFELVLDEDAKQRARIPLRVLINPHDTTDSIVSTVKNFYGIYEGRGVSFEDRHANTLIAKYENFKNDMVVYVRVTPYDPYLNHHASTAPYPADDGYSKPSLGEPFQMMPPQAPQGIDMSQLPSRPSSRLARKRSISPGRDRRSMSSQKAGSRAGGRSRDTSAHGSSHDDAANGYSDSDNGHGSTTSSRRAKGEQFVTAEISLENIMQDGRRMRPKFDSSELPLFVPPQVPLAASTSSISPQRRSTGQDDPSPFARPAQRPYPSHIYTLPSPQSSNQYEVHAWHTPNGFGQTPNGGSQHGPRLRERTSTLSISNVSIGRGGMHTTGILPTPDPTVASCISDEDVARQLIALGNDSHFSHGRTSASTADDAFSGVAERASSTGATSDSESQSEDEEGLPPYPKETEYGKKPRHSYASDPDDEVVDDEYRDSEAMIKSEYDEYDNEVPKAKRIKTKAGSAGPPRASISKSGSVSKISKVGTARPIAVPKKPRTPGSTHNGAGPQAPRKTSSASTSTLQQLGAHEEDLSAKPRCQRCRKSKKGCDRQRPCQRCKDAGISIEGCVSEDEGNGRKGRYGRHMGVVIKKDDGSIEIDDYQAVGAILTGMATAESADKNKKRKR